MKLKKQEKNNKNGGEISAIYDVNTIIEVGNSLYEVIKVFGDHGFLMEIRIEDEMLVLYVLTSSRKKVLKYLFSGKYTLEDGIELI